MRKEVAKKVADHLRKFPDDFPRPIENDEELQVFEVPFSLTDEEGELLAQIMPYPEHIDDLAKRIGRDKAELIPLLDNLIKKLWVLRVGSREEGTYQAHTTTFEFYMPWLNQELADFRWKIIEASMPENPEEGFRPIGIADNEILPPFRIVPRENALPLGSEVLSTDKVTFLIDQAKEGELAVADCLCRKEKLIIGDPCPRGGPIEQCLFFDPFATAAVEAGVARPITKAEAYDLMKRAREHGLVHHSYNSVHPKTICSCCPCCCPLLQFANSGIEGITTRSNFFAQIDPNKCKGSKECIERCTGNAISFDEKKKTAIIDAAKCFGCGICVETCPNQAPSLKPKPKVMPVPKTDEERLEIKARQTGKTELYQSKWAKQ